MGALEDKLQAILDGARNSASIGLGDELSPEISTMLPGPKDPEGIPREYAAGSAESDMRNSMRDNSAELQRKYPKNYATGSVIGGAPGAMALPALEAPAAGLLGGLMGAVRGAGESDGQDMVGGAARQAGIEGLLGMFGGMVPEAVQGAKGMAQEAPQLATAEAKAIPGGVQINRTEMMPPPRGSTIDLGDMPEIPKAGKTGIRESMIPDLEKEAQAADEFTGAANKRLVERSMKKEASRTTPINRDAEYIKNFADQKEAGVAARAKEAPKDFGVEEESGVVSKTPVMRGLKKKPVAVAQETVKVQAEPDLKSVVAEGVHPDELGRLMGGMKRGSHGPVDMEAMRAPYAGKDPTEVATTHFTPIDVTVEPTSTGPSWWLKDGRHRLQNALDSGAKAIKANVTHAGTGENLFSGSLPFKSKAPAEELPISDDLSKYFDR